MERQPVPSSNVKAIGYDPDSRKLHVEFSSGSIYEYEGVAREDHSNFVNNPIDGSHGSHFARFIKSKYQGTKL